MTGIYSSRSRFINNAKTSRSTGLVIFFLHIGLGLLALFASQIGGFNDWGALTPFCLSSIVLLAWFVYRTLIADPSRILHEMSVYLAISGAVYLAFGPLLYVFGPKETIDYSMSFFPVSSSDALWLTGLNFVGFGLAGVVYFISKCPPVSVVSRQAASHWCRLNSKRVLVVLVFVGLVAKYGFVLPYELRISDVMPNGLTRQLAALLLLALLIGMSTRRTSPWWVGWLTTIILVSEVVTGFLMFNKTVAVLAVLVAGLGVYFESGRLRSLLVAAAAGIFLFVSIGPIVTFGRNELTFIGGTEPAPASLVMRFGIAAAYFAGGEGHSRANEVPGAGWSRLNYLPSQNAAVTFWRQGNGGDDFLKLPWIVVPRLLYKDKPIMSTAGLDLQEKVHGLRNSHAGIGIFADGYYNWGWFGVLVYGSSFGFVLRVFTDMARPIIHYRAIAMYPLVFMGIFLGLRIDGWWLGTVMGSLIFGLAGLICFRIAAPR